MTMEKCTPTLLSHTDLTDITTWSMLLDYFNSFKPRLERKEATMMISLGPSILLRHFLMEATATISTKEGICSIPFIMGDIPTTRTPCMPWPTLLTKCMLGSVTKPKEYLSIHITIDIIGWGIGQIFIKCIKLNNLGEKSNATESSSVVNILFLRVQFLFEIKFSVC